MKTTTLTVTPKHLQAGDIIVGATQDEGLSMRLRSVKPDAFEDGRWTLNIDGLETINCHGQKQWTVRREEEVEPFEKRTVVRIFGVPYMRDGDEGWHYIDNYGRLGQAVLNDEGVRLLLEDGSNKILS